MSTIFPLEDIKPPRDSGWIITATGRKFWPLDARPDDVCIEDIAHALSMCCRYAGHCPEFYSVAEHSFYVSHAIGGFGSRLALMGLLHDASEAYLGDMTRPVKQRMPEYKAAEERLERVIWEHFGLLDFAYHPATVGMVKKADTGMLITERLQFFKPETHPGAAADFKNWQDQGEALTGYKLHCLPPREAKEVFLERFKSLGGKP